MTQKSTNRRAGDAAARQTTEALERPVVSPDRRIQQVTTPRTGAPRLAVPGWHHIAAVLAREPQVSETALSAALRRALEQSEAGR